jgi:hypothetical protein
VSRAARVHGRRARDPRRTREISDPVYRLVTQPPQRLSMDALAAVCDILGCTPGDL